jgi:DNA topoisomerase-1
MVLPSELPDDLVYIRDINPGYTRTKKKDKFHYFDQSGKPITDPSKLDRINALVIPPAWKSVWISPKKNSYLQATGLDDKNRKQYRYHTNWSTYSQKLKYDQLHSFGLFLPNLRKRYNTDLGKRGWPKEKVLALAVAVLDDLFLRTGNSQYTEKNNTYGLTTLRRRHIGINGKAMELKYTGKSGVSRMINLTDKRLVRLLKGCSQLPGYEIFRYQEDGKWYTVDSSEINEYINVDKAANHYFTAKYFRTWGANSLCIKNKREALESVKNTRKKPETALIRSIAKKMGHTVSTCKSHYLHPEVIGFCMENNCDSLRIPKSIAENDYKPEERTLMTILKKIVKE